MIPLSWYVDLCCCALLYWPVWCAGAQEFGGHFDGRRIDAQRRQCQPDCLLALFRTRRERIAHGPGFVAMVLAAAAAEAAVGLALIISAYRRRKTVVADELNLMKG